MTGVLSAAVVRISVFFAVDVISVDERVILTWKIF
jgi:hypothetical protein